MDTKKIVLYLLLGVVLFALWEAWQKDYAPSSVLGLQTQTDQTVQAAGTGADAERKADVAKGPKDSAISEKRQKEEATEAGEPGNISPAASYNIINVHKVPEERLVNVRTDVLNVFIDKKGGNIVEANLLKYKAEINKPNPVKLLSDDINNLYIAQSGLISDQGPDAKNSQAEYKVEKTEYILQPNQNEIAVKLSWTNNKGIEVYKVFTLKRGQYAINVDYTIENKSKNAFAGQIYAQLRHKNVEVKQKAFRYGTFVGATLSSPEHPYEKLSYKSLAEENLNRDIQGGWIALQEHYFISVWVPDNKEKIYRYFSDHSAGEFYTAGFVDNEVEVDPGKTLKTGMTLYAGPEIAENLKAVAPHLDLAVDYGWLWMISVVLFWIMKKIYSVVGNWGWSIILVTILIRVLFYKFTEAASRSTARMKNLAPKMKALKERYGADKQKLSQATMELYRKEKVNPLGGCLPMLLPIPVFIALYYVLVEAVQLRQAPFMFWIHDLAGKDPYYVLPILMGLSMFIQQKLTPTSADPTQAKIMMFLPVVFTVFFLQFPAGLVLYWFVNNCLSILQQWYINKKLEHEGVKEKIQKHLKRA